MPKVRKAELSFLYATCCLILFYISTKYHRNIQKGILVTERTQNLFQIKQRVITLKVRKPDFSILYATSQLVLIYISTKYHQNIPKGIQVTERTRSFTPTPTGSIPKTICPLLPNNMFPLFHFGREGYKYHHDNKGWSLVTSLYSQDIILVTSLYCHNIILISF